MLFTSSVPFSPLIANDVSILDVKLKLAQISLNIDTPFSLPKTLIQQQVNNGEYFTNLQCGKNLQIVIPHYYDLANADWSLFTSFDLKINNKLVFKFN